MRISEAQADASLLSTQHAAPNASSPLHASSPFPPRPAFSLESRIYAGLPPSRRRTHSEHAILLKEAGKRPRLASVVLPASALDGTPGRVPAHHDASPSPVDSPGLDPARLIKLATTACHICRRKPTLRSHVSHYAFCHGCGAWTCGVCSRDCSAGGDETEEPGSASPDVHLLAQDWAGAGGLPFGFRGGPAAHGGYRHRRKICSACCVERGPEGEVWCLGCVGIEAVAMEA